LLASLSSCFALALAWAAGKQGVELPHLEVTATGHYDEGTR
jgi:organic hydroperoxide reductase OsmC/OhrA